MTYPGLLNGPTHPPVPNTVPPESTSSSHRSNSAVGRTSLPEPASSSGLPPVLPPASSFAAATYPAAAPKHPPMPPPGPRATSHVEPPTMPPTQQGVPRPDHGLSRRDTAAPTQSISRQNQLPGAPKVHQQNAEPPQVSPKRPFPPPPTNPYLVRCTTDQERMTRPPPGPTGNPIYSPYEDAWVYPPPRPQPASPPANAPSQPSSIVCPRCTVANTPERVHHFGTCRWCEGDLRRPRL